MAGVSVLFRGWLGCVMNCGCVVFGVVPYSSIEAVPRVERCGCCFIVTLCHVGCFMVIV